MDKIREHTKQMKEKCVALHKSRNSYEKNSYSVSTVRAIKKWNGYKIIGEGLKFTSSPHTGTRIVKGKKKEFSKHYCW